MFNVDASDEGIVIAEISTRIEAKLPSVFYCSDAKMRFSNVCKVNQVDSFPSFSSIVMASKTLRKKCKTNNFHYRYFQFSLSCNQAINFLCRLMPRVKMSTYILKQDK